MKVTFSSDSISQIKADNVVIFVPEFEKPADARLNQLDQASRGVLTRMAEAGEFTGAEGLVAVVSAPDGYEAARVICVGLGEKKKVDADTYRRAAGTVSRFKGLTRYTTAAFHFGDVDDAAVYQAVIEGYLLGSFKLLDYKSGDDGVSDVSLKDLVFAVENRRLLKRLEKAIETGRVIAEGQLLVRTLALTPGNFLTPQKMARKSQDLAKKTDGLTCTVLDEKEIAREKMGALISVGQGSANPPRFVVLKYEGGRAKQKPVVLVGKGVTFDSGGISLKQSLGMQEMKGDMTGSAVVLASLITAARLKLPLNVVGLMPMAENMPSSKATRPGDIVTSRKGLTIEVINTDAEGRLILADALDYANEFDPQAVIDVATLTGGALYVLGYSGAPIMGNNPTLMDRLRSAAEATAERVWEMPIWDDFRDLMKSDIADLKNSGGKPAPTMTAGAFLENFTGDWPWAHVDIAYVDIEPSGRPYLPKGVTGIGLRLFVSVLQNWRKL